MNIPSYLQDKSFSYNLSSNIHQSSVTDNQRDLPSYAVRIDDAAGGASLKNSSVDDSLLKGESQLKIKEQQMKLGPSHPTKQQFGVRKTSARYQSPDIENMKESMMVDPSMLENLEGQKAIANRNSASMMNDQQVGLIHASGSNMVVDEYQNKVFHNQISSGSVMGGAEASVSGLHR